MAGKFKFTTNSLILHNRQFIILKLQTEVCNFDPFFSLQINKQLQNVGKNFGNTDDIYGAYKALIQLQMTYKLDTYKMAKGQLEHKGVLYQG